MKYTESILELIGNTPMVRSGYLSENGCDVFVKLEYYNPGGSIKDRAALGMIEQAEALGALKPGYEVVEASSGNMAIGLALVCAAKGYKLTLVMCEDVSINRIELLKAYGANIILTPKGLGIVGSMTEAENYSLGNKHVFVVRQFENRDNADVHYKTTGPEIWKQMRGNVDFFVCSVGSGGTIMGVARYLKEKNPDVKIVAVEPENSAVISSEKANSHKFSGMGVNFIPQLLDVSLIDMIIKAPFCQSLKVALEIAKKDKLMLGIASGAMMYSVGECTKMFANSRIVTIGSVHGERYGLSNLYGADGASENVSLMPEI